MVQVSMRNKWFATQDNTVPTPMIRLETFQELITQTRDFFSLCQGIHAALPLEWEKSAIMQDISCKIIEKLILRNLPAGDARGQCCVKFRMPAQNLRSRLQNSEHAAQSRSGSKHVSLGNIFTISISGDAAQGATVSNYFAQTWTGYDLLVPAIDDQIHNHLSAELSHESSETTSRKLKLRTSVEDDLLIIEASGDIRSVVECGEKLCWLASFLCPEFAKGTIISESSLTEPSARLGSFWRRQEPCVEFEIKTEMFREPNHSDSWLKGLRRFHALQLFGDFRWRVGLMNFPLDLSYI